MQTENTEIRSITDGDIRTCLDIYNYYIENTTITFEEEPLTEAEFLERVTRIKKNYPYIVCVSDGRTIGYAYLDKYSERSAFRFTADLSIYVDKDFRHFGVGAELYRHIEKLAKEAGIRNIISVITSENDASVAFHEKNGFESVGRISDVGFKFGKWLGVDFYRKKL